MCILAYNIALKHEVKLIGVKGKTDNTINQLDLIGIYRTVSDYIFFSSTQGPFTK